MGRDARKQDLAGRRRRPVTRSRRPAAMIGIGLVSIAAAGAAIGGAASAAVPEFPDNLVVFPNRDFVTVEGYQDHIGETATAQGDPRRTRSSARPRRSSPRATSRSRSTTPAALLGRGNEPAGHARHQGGRQGLDLVRRPARRRHDRAGRGGRRDPDAQRAHADRHGPHRRRAWTGQLEQRIVNPDLTGTDVGRRDVRARARPADAAPQGRLLVRPGRSPATRSPRRTSSTPRRPPDRRERRRRAPACPGRSGRRRQPPGPDHRRVRRARRPRHGRLPGRPGRRRSRRKPGTSPRALRATRLGQVNWAPAVARRRRAHHRLQRRGDRRSVPGVRARACGRAPARPPPQLTATRRPASYSVEVRSHRRRPHDRGVHRRGPLSAGPAARHHRAGRQGIAGRRGPAADHEHELVTLTATSPAPTSTTRTTARPASRRACRGTPRSSTPPPIADHGATEDPSSLRSTAPATSPRAGARSRRRGPAAPAAARDATPTSTGGQEPVALKWAAFAADPNHRLRRHL